MVTTFRVPQPVAAPAEAGRVAVVTPVRKISVEGRVVRKMIPPPALRPLAKVRIDDGSGQVILVLPGRRSLAEIPIDSVVRAEGVVNGHERDIPTIFDPVFEVVSLI